MRDVTEKIISILLLCSVCLSLGIYLGQGSDHRQPPTVIDLRAPQPGVCPPVQVTCECPAYEQGWEDADFVRGEIDDDYCSPENLEQVCADFIEYGPEDFAEFSEPDC